jgi:hypothetical protein
LSALDTPLKYHEQELSYAGINLKNLVRSGKKVRGDNQCAADQIQNTWRLSYAELAYVPAAAVFQLSLVMQLLLPG